jgi:vacuolar-type H+-ATPase subunit H
MAASAWKPGNSGGTSWTIKGVHESTREAVREAAAEAEMMIGEWVDRALGQAAQEALHPSPPPATRDDVAIVAKQLAELKATILALAESKASAQALAELKASVQTMSERTKGYERPMVRHVMVEHKRAARLPAQPRVPDKSGRDS